MTALRAALFALLWCLAASAFAADLWGRVVWNTGAPAAGIELRLVKRGAVQPGRIMTNNAGRYGLYALSAPTSDYSLQVLRGTAVVKTVPLPSLGNGGRVPDIVMP
jgi:hypothetical protein